MACISPHFELIYSMKYFCTRCQAYTERDLNKCCPKCEADLREASIEPSTVIAGFEIIREIGRGANGIVYLARQTSLDRQVALKILPDAKAEDPDFVKAFLKEARAAARLNHPNIIQAYDAGVTREGINYLAMELIEGKSLETHLQLKGKFKEHEAVKIMLEQARALSYSWEKEHLFHGDIKPDNIMIRKDGQSKLADFGLAKTAFEEKTTDEIMATPMYAPPEVITAEHDRIGFRSDMYSFGVTLYELLCGTPPFDEMDCQKVLEMHLDEFHKPLTDKLPDINKSLSKLVDQLLEKEPEKRPDSWKKVIHILEKVQSSEDDSNKNHNLFMVLAALVPIVLLSTVGIFFYYHSKGSKANKNSAANPKTEIVQEQEQPEETQVSPEVAETKQPETQPKPPPAPKPQPAKKPEIKIDEYKRKLASFNESFNQINELDILSAAKLKNEGLRLAQNKKAAKNIYISLGKIEKHIQNIALKQDSLEVKTFQKRLRFERRKELSRQKEFAQTQKHLAEINDILKVYAEFLSLQPQQQTARELSDLLKEANNLNKKLPEYRSLRFLSKSLPTKYNREACIFQNLDQLKGKPLPWKIRRKEYIITGGSWQSMHLHTILSKGVYSRKKLRGSNLSKRHWCLLVKKFLVEGNLKCAPKHLRNTACWLLLNAPEDLLKSFVKKYFPEKSKAYLACRNVIDKTTPEIAAYKAWSLIEFQMKELNQMTYNGINSFISEHSKTEVYKSVKTELENYQATLAPIYLEAVINKLKINSLTIKDDYGKIFAAQNRYRFLSRMSKRSRKNLKELYRKTISLLAVKNEMNEGEFGIFDYQPCGSVYHWIMSESKKAGYNSLCYIPALIDVSSWSYIAHSMKKIPLSNKLFPPQVMEKTKQYPFFLYNVGLAATRLNKIRVLEKVKLEFTALMKTPEANYYSYALAADLALQNKQNSSAWRILNKYSFDEKLNDNEIIIPLYKIQCLLTQKPLKELAVAKFIDSTREQFADNAMLAVDVMVLGELKKFICAEYRHNTRIPADLFSKTRYPHLHARLWLEIAARDRLLQRNSINTSSFMKACHSALAPSAFRSALYKQMTYFSMVDKLSTPAEMIRQVNSKLTNMASYTPESYPSLLTMLFVYEALECKAKVNKLAPYARAFSHNCPVFSATERQFSRILGNSETDRILEMSENANRNGTQTFFLYMLASAKAKHNKTPDRYSKKLKSLQKNLSWTEELLLKRFIQVINNY